MTAADPVMNPNQDVASPSPSTATKWEYAWVVMAMQGEGRRVVSINGRIVGDEGGPSSWELFPILNEMGAEGWELAAVVPILPPSPNAALPMGIYEYVLKRARRRSVT